jgi:hypothetical protein
MRDRRRAAYFDRPGAGTRSGENVMKGTKMKTKLLSAIVAFVIAGIGAAEAGRMTCTDYDRPDVFADCQSSGPTEMDHGQCCSGAAAFKAACDVFHGARPESTADARELVNSTRAGRKRASLRSRAAGWQQRVDGKLSSRAGRSHALRLGR